MHANEGYIGDPKLVYFYPDTFSALRKLRDNFHLFIVTNQSGIAKNLITEPEVLAVNKFIENDLYKEGVEIKKTYYCPYNREDNCVCMKPSPYFLRKAAAEFGIDLSASYIIGDHPSDVECGINAGVSSIYVLSGHGEKHRNEMDFNVPVCNGISDSVDLIMSSLNNTRDID